MNISWRISIFWLSLALALFLQSTAHAQAIGSAASTFKLYLNEWEKYRFSTEMTMAEFRKLPPDFQPIALAQLISHVDYGKIGDAQSSHISDRAAIMKEHFDSLSPSQQEQIQAWAFDLSLHYSNTPEQFEQAQKYFQRLVERDPQAAMQRICAAVSLMATMSLEEDRDTLNFEEARPSLLGIKAEASSHLAQLVAMVPPMLDKSCRVQIDDRTLFYSAREVIESHQNSPTDSDDTNSKEALQQFLLKEYSSCSENQLRPILSDAIVAANKLKAGGTVLFRRESGSCIVDAQIRRLKNGYDFAPSTGIIGYKKITIPFRDLNQIISKLKAQPQTYIIWRTQKPAR